MPRWLLVVAYSEIASAVVGLIGFVWIGAVLPTFVGSVSCVLGSIFFVTAAVAGAQLLRGRRLGAILSFGVQLLQVVAFSFGPRFVARAGILGAIVFASNGLRVEGGFDGRFVATTIHNGELDAGGTGLDFGTGFAGSPLRDSTVTVAVNLVAIYFAFRLWRYLRDERQVADPLAV